MNSLEKDFVPYEPSLALKELGFNEPCFGYYKENQYELHKEFHCYNSDYVEHLEVYIAAPTFSQAFRWFRDKYKLHHSIDYECSQHDHTWGYNWSIYNYNQVVKTDEEYITSHPDAPAGEWVYDSDGEAELACLRKLIEIVKNC